MVDANKSPKNTPRSPEGATEPIRKYRRRQRWMLLLKLVILLVVILLGALIYLQSSHALLHVYLPMASKSLGTQVKADDGSLNLTKGRLTLDNLLVNGVDGQPAVQVGHLVFQMSLFSLLSDKIPTIDEIRLIDPRLNVSVDENGRSNLDFNPSAADGKNGHGNGENHASLPGNSSRPQLLPELRIGVIEVRNLILDYRDAQGLSLNVSPLNLNVENIAPGSTGAFGLDLTADLARPEQNMHEKTQLSLNGSVTQADTRESLQWDATMETNITGTVPGLDAPQSLDIDASGKGAYQVTGRVEQQLTLNATNPSGQAGRIDAQMTWDKEANQREATLDISDVGRDFLNPLIAAFAPVQIAQSVLNGQVKVKGIGDSILFETAFNGRDLSFRTGGNPQPTPPMNLTIANRGSYLPDSGIATLEVLNVALNEKERNLVVVNLDQPVTLALAAPAGSSSEGQSSSAAIDVKIQTLTLDQVRPWLALAGTPDTGPVQAATLNGNYKLAIEQMGKQLALNGQADLVNLQLKEVATRGLTIRHEISMNVKPGNELDVGKSTVRFEQNGNTLAELTATGQMQLAEGDSNLDLTFTIPKVLALAEALQPQTAITNLRDGSLIAEQKIVMNQETQLISVTGKAGLDGMALTLPGRDPLSLKADADYDLELDNAASRLKIKPLRIQMAQAKAAQPGVIEVQGDWPTGPIGPHGLPEGEGNLSLSIRDLDAAPWLRLTGALSEEALPSSLPIAADNKLTLEKGGTIKSSGELNVGPVDVKDDNGLSTELSFKVQHEIEKFGQQLRTLVIDLTSRSGGEAADNVHVEGSGDLGEAVNLNLTSRIERLDLAPYLALAQSLTPEETPGQAGEESQTGDEEKTGEEQNGQAAPAGLITMDIDVRKLLFKSIDVENLKGNLRKEDQVVSLKLDEGTINGGTVMADVMNDSGRIDPRFSWELAMEKVPVTPLLQTFSPENSEKLSGALTLNSRGAGEGTGEDLLRRLQSETSFTIEDGKMENYFILDILAEQTKVESFKNLSFFRFAGDVDVADGKANLNNWRVNGSVHQLSMNGTVTLPNEYDLNLQAGVGSEMVSKITNNPFTGKLMMTDEGYFRFPLIISIKGQGDDYRVMPKLDVTGVVKGAAEQLGGAVGGVGEKAMDLGGAVGGALEGLLDRNK